MNDLTSIELFAGIAGFSSPHIRLVAFVEIEPSCRAILRRHHPGVLILEDVRECGVHNLPWANVIKFGFPCQDLSVAGNRAGLSGARSGLFYEATRIVNELRPDYAVWENVPGLLSSGAGRDFLAVLTELDRIGYVGGWRTLDAQYLGVAQRRRRVFGVFARRDIGATRCAEILSLATGMSGDTPPRRETRARIAPTLESGTNRTGGTRPPGTTVDTAETLIPIGYSTSGQGWWRDGIGPEVARSHKDAENGVVVCGAQSAAHGGPDDNSAQAGHVVVASREVTQALTTTYGKQPDSSDTNLGPSLAISSAFGVRRLTPREAERLQGFPDDYSAWGVDENGQRIEMSDSLRYRALGNAVNRKVAEWLDRRIVQYS